MTKGKNIPEIHWRTWRKLFRRMTYKPDLAFVIGVWRGMSLLEAYQFSDEKRRDASPQDVKAAIARILCRFERELGPLFRHKEARREALAHMAEMVIEDQLRSGDAKERSDGVKHARAICGMDAPTRQEVAVNPHLDTSELVPFVPARERFGGEN